MQKFYTKKKEIIRKCYLAIIYAMYVLTVIAMQLMW